PPDAVIAQIEAVTDDIGVQAAKTGMLLNAEIIEAVSERLSAQPIERLVVDPVMVSRTGATLIAEDAIAALTQKLLPLATILTPNRYEAQILADMKIDSLEDMQTAAQKIRALGPGAVIVKGGGFEGDLRAVDVWCDGNHQEVLTTEAVDTTNTHGTGCTLSSAIAANLAKGFDLLTATVDAKSYVTQALKYSLSIGKGQGPVGHFYPLFKDL
ncbi:MAG: bifunctional hydroxymethylpyrimidine kinase/phosphomethylpyrimidine kinase, partial [Cyanobacteria bacterium J06649_4]